MTRALPHICFVAPFAWPVLSGDKTTDFAGGAEVQQCLVARSLARAGYRVSMICMDHGQPDSVTVDGVTVVKCHAEVGGLPIIRFFHPRLTGLWSALRRVNADIYYQRTAGAQTGVVALFARRYGRRFIYAAAHDLDLARDETWKLFQRRAGWRDRQMFELGVRLADAIVAQRPKQEEDCLRSYGRTPTFVRSCYSARPDAHADVQGAVLWVSTMRSWKRPELFLELARQLPHVRFRMVGGPSSEKGGAELFARIKSAADEIPNMDFVGFVPYSEVETCFDSARIFVNTSDNEGFPNTFLQSWARGIPTVSFVDTGSVVDGRSVVTVVRNIDEMATAVDTLARDDARWRDAGSRARTCFQTLHSVESTTAAYERLFSSLTSSHDHPLIAEVAERC